MCTLLHNDDVVLIVEEISMHYKRKFDSELQEALKPKPASSFEPESEPSEQQGPKLKRLKVFELAD